MDNELTMVVAVCALILSVAALLRKPKGLPATHQCIWKTISVNERMRQYEHWETGRKIGEVHVQECKLCGDVREKVLGDS